MFYTDSTHLKASANKNKYEFHQVDQQPAHYLAELNAAVDEDRLAHDKKPLPPILQDQAPEQKEVKISPVDPDAGYMVRDGKPTGGFLSRPSHR